MALIITLLIAPFAALAGFASLFTRPRRLHHIFFACFAFSAAAWTAVNYLAVSSSALGEVTETVRNVRLVMVFAALQTAFFAFFALAFRREQWKHFRIMGVVLIVALALSLVFVVTGGVFQDSVQNRDGQIIPNVGWAIAPFGILILFNISLGVAELWKQARTSYTLKTLQARYILMGLATTFALDFLFAFLVTVLFSSVAFVPYSPLFLLPFLVMTLYATLRYRLLSLGNFFMHSLWLLAEIAVLIALVSWGLFWYEQAVTGDARDGVSSFVIATIVALLIAVVHVAFRLLRYATRRRESVVLFESRDLNFLDLGSRIQHELAKRAIRKSALLVMDQDSGTYRFTYPEEMRDIPRLDVHNKLIRFLRERRHVLIREEIPMQAARMDKANASLAHDAEHAMQKMDVTAAVPVGQEKLLGVVLVFDSQRRQPFTVERVAFLEELQKELHTVFEGIFLYEDALRRAVARRDGNAA